MDGEGVCEVRVGGRIGDKIIHLARKEDFNSSFYYDLLCAINSQR